MNEYWVQNSWVRAPTDVQNPCRGPKANTSTDSVSTLYRGTQVRPWHVMASPKREKDRGGTRSQVLRDPVESGRAQWEGACSLGCCSTNHIPALPFQKNQCQHVTSPYWASSMAFKMEITFIYRKKWLLCLSATAQIKYPAGDLASQWIFIHSPYGPVAAPKFDSCLEGCLLQKETWTKTKIFNNWTDRMCQCALFVFMRTCQIKRDSKNRKKHQKNKTEGSLP